MNVKITFVLLLLTVAALAMMPQASAFQNYLTNFNTTYPSAVGSRIDNCMLCHAGPNPSVNDSDKPRNLYGLDFASHGHNFTEIESIDSDIDGFTNIDEIHNLTFPGNASDFPHVTNVTSASTISGFKINDTNGNGIWDSGEMGIENWNIRLKNAANDTEIANTTTDASGFYRFTNLTNGSYNVSEVMRTGWRSTNDTFKLVNISGRDIINLNFTNNLSAQPPVQETFSISGFKINDTNGNGIWDSGEMGIENWNIRLKNAANDTEIANTTTDASGFYRFTNLTNGSYNVSEVMRDGWANTSATSRNITLNNNTVNLNFTNQPVLPKEPVVTSIELTPERTVVLKKTAVSITIRALNAGVLETRYNGTANITITANNASTVTYPNTTNFTGGVATIQINSDIAQIVTVTANTTAANNSINGSTSVMFADKVFNLSKGWNLISIPNFADQSSINQTLALVLNNGIVGYDPATNTFSTPADLQPLFGYWVNVTADNQSIGFIASMNTTTSVPPVRKLYEGWNLIGVSASRNDPDNLSAGELFVDLKHGLDYTLWLYTRLVSYEQPASPVTFVAGIDLSDLTTLRQGRGYWLFIKNIPGTDKNNVPWSGKQW